MNESWHTHKQDMSAESRVRLLMSLPSGTTNKSKETYEYEKRPVKKTYTYEKRHTDSLSALRYATVVLQCVAVCCYVLPCAAVCCSIAVAARRYVKYVIRDL